MSKRARVIATAAVAAVAVVVVLGAVVGACDTTTTTAQSTTTAPSTTTTTPATTHTPIAHAAATHTTTTTRVTATHAAPPPPQAPAPADSRPWALGVPWHGSGTPMQCSPVVYTVTGNELWVSVDGPQTIAWSAAGGAGDEATVAEGMSGHTFELPDGTTTSGLVLIASGNADEQRDECALP